MRWSAICLVWMLGVGPVAAQDQQIVQRMTTAFDGWMQQNDVQQGALAIWYRGIPVKTHALGMDGSTPVEMASLSKAVTGICVAELVREGKLAYSDPFLSVDGRSLDVTIAQLLNHATGLKTDSTQEKMGDWLNHPKHRTTEVLDGVLERGGPSSKPNRYRYNNENYALLGVMIEKASGDSYESACQRRVFYPAGVSAEPSPQSGGFLSWGGWQMSVDDYAKFLSYWYGPQSELGRDPFALPHIEVGGGAQYGFGMFFRDFRDRFNFWHFGALCFSNRLNVGSFAVTWRGDWSAVAAYNICPTWDAMGDLDGALSGAVFR